MLTLALAKGPSGPIFNLWFCKSFRNIHSEISAKSWICKICVKVVFVLFLPAVQEVQPITTGNMAMYSHNNHGSIYCLRQAFGPWKMHSGGTLDAVKHTCSQKQMLAFHKRCTCDGTGAHAACHSKFSIYMIKKSNSFEFATRSMWILCL